MIPSDYPVSDHIAKVICVGMIAAFLLLPVACGIAWCHRRRRAEILEAFVPWALVVLAIVAGLGGLYGLGSLVLWGMQ